MIDLDQCFGVMEADDVSHPGKNSIRELVFEIPLQLLSRIGQGELFKDALGSCYEKHFEGANVSDTVFADLDFSSCAGLDSVRHYGPSTLGFDSIIRSKGSIPAAFLRGVGAIVDWTC